MDAVDDRLEVRHRWLSDAHARYRGHRRDGLQLSTHGLLLQVDLERAFVGGAWAAVLVLAQAVIEATIRQIQVHDYDSRAKGLFKGVKRLERLRALRNELLHPAPPGTPSLIWRVPNGDFQACHELLEEDAKRAVEYMLYVVYSGQWAAEKGRHEAEQVGRHGHAPARSSPSKPPVDTGPQRS
jgi:hypothetical protein